MTVKNLITFLMFFAMLFFSSCSSQVPRYSLNPEIQYILKEQIENENAKISVEVFGASKRKKLCRLAMEIYPPDNKTFEEYIKDAFINELRSQNLYDRKSHHIIKIYITSLDFDSFRGYWLISGNVKLPNGKTFSVAKMYNFGFIYLGDQACREVLRTFPNAVQDFIKEIVKNPLFISYIKNSKHT